MPVRAARVDIDHAMSARAQQLDKVSADKSAASGHQDFHAGDEGNPFIRCGFDTPEVAPACRESGIGFQPMKTSHGVASSDRG